MLIYLRQLTHPRRHFVRCPFLRKRKEEKGKENFNIMSPPFAEQRGGGG